MTRDIIIEEGTNNLKIENGDFVLGETEQQNINFILVASKGNFYQTPQIGVNLISFLNSSSGNQRIFNKIETNLNFDNYKNVEVEFIDGKLYVDAKRKQ